MYRFFNFIVEGFAVMIIACIIARNDLHIWEICLIGIIAMIIYIIIDMVSHMLQNQHSLTIPHPDVKQTTPVPDIPKSEPYANIYGIMSRWMNWPVLSHNSDNNIAHHGYYSDLTLKSGYNENIKPFETTEWSLFNPHETTGINYQGNMSSEMTGGGTDSDNLETRLNDVIYSGDLIEISSETNVLQRMPNNSQITLDQPLPDIKTNLSKLRFETLSGHGPIKYGETIYFKHNALIDNKNQTRFIKYGERLQSHQEGPIYELFKLFKKNSPDYTGYVKYGDQLVIACGDQEGDKVHLKIENDKSISVESLIDDAIVFTISLIKPYHEFILCVCPDEHIFP